MVSRSVFAKRLHVNHNTSFHLQFLTDFLLHLVTKFVRLTDLHIGIDQNVHIDIEILFSATASNIMDSVHLWKSERNITDCVCICDGLVYEHFTGGANDFNGCANDESGDNQGGDRIDDWRQTEFDA